MRIICKALAALTALAVLAFGGYVGYVYFSYERIGDNTALEIKNASDARAATGENYRLASYNIGFGAYSPDYSFFMDGGDESRARSEDECMRNITGAFGTLAGADADIIMIQEIDTDADRSFSINQVAVAETGFADYSSVFAVNYDSAYLFYPFTHPIGRSKSGLLTLSRLAPYSALRRSLPVDSGFQKLIDLDRCYSIVRVPVDNGRDLVLINLHLSAYTSDGSIVNDQISMLSAEIAAEYEAGNYVICAGDFNRNLTGTGLALNEGAADSWEKAFDIRQLPEHFALVPPGGADGQIPTCRDAGEAYIEGSTQTYVLDGFIVSDNVTVVSAGVTDTGFAFSDHNPVVLEFSLEAYE